MSRDSATDGGSTTVMEMLLEDRQRRLAAMRSHWLMAVAVLCAAGLLMVYSASAVRAGRGAGDMALLLSQGQGLLLGLAVFAVASWIPLEWYRRWWPLWPGLCLTLLAGVLAFGTLVNGSVRWFRVAGINVQPSEMAKPLLILTLAIWLSGARDGRPRMFGRAGASLLFAAATAGLLVLEPDLGSAGLLVSVAFVMLLAGGLHWVWSVVLTAGGALAAWQGVVHFAHVQKRMTEWLARSGEHTNLSKAAIGSGGLYGMGLGHGTSKLDYLPEAHTDFIFAMIGQEFGLVGSVVVVGLFAFVMFQGLRLAWMLTERLPALVVFGVSMMLGGQALFNMGVVTGLLPPKGIQLPFVSFGSSGLVMNLAMAGLVAAATRPETLAGDVGADRPGGVDAVRAFSARARARVRVRADGPAGRRTS